MTFKELRQAVFLHKPILKQVLEQHGHRPLLDYFEDSLNAPCIVPSERQEELLSVVRKKISTCIDQAVAEKATNQLRDHYYVSTADHDGPIVHPFFVNSHIAQSFANRLHGLDATIVFSCSGISLNNSSFPRGLFFHTRRLHEERARFFSLKHRRHPVYGFPAYTSSEIKSAISDIHQVRGISSGDKEKTHELLKTIYKSEAALSFKRYTEQTTHTNHLLFQRIPGQEQTHLVTLSIEEITNDLLLTYHIEKETLLSRLLTNDAYLDAFEKNFNGIHGAFSTKDSRGTFLFWAIHNGERKQLYRTGKTLHTQDDSYTIDLNAETIRAAIEKKELMPSMALSLITVSFYYGLRCGGGFSQVNYLTYMKEAYLRFLEAVQRTEEMPYVSRLKTDYFCGEFVFATLKKHQRSVHATSLDLILYGNKDTGTQLQETANICTLNEAVDRMMPEFHKIIYGQYPTAASPAVQEYSSLYV